MTPDAPAPEPRRPRRAVRRAGTVGTDDAPLRTTLPAAPPPQARPTPSSPTRPSPTQLGTAAPGTAAPASLGAPDPWTATRSADDSDTGWGERADSNDDRLRRDKPPHW